MANGDVFVNVMKKTDSFNSHNMSQYKVSRNEVCLHNEL